MKAAIPTAHIQVSGTDEAGPDFLERFSCLYYPLYSVYHPKLTLHATGHSTIDQTTFLTLPHGMGVIRPLFFCLLKCVTFFFY